MTNLLVSLSTKFYNTDVSHDNTMNRRLQISYYRRRNIVSVKEYTESVSHLVRIIVYLSRELAHFELLALKNGALMSLLTSQID